MGCGVVGSGVVELIASNKEKIAEKCGADFVDVKYILDLREFPGKPYANKVVKDINIITEDPEVNVVVETMGGCNAAFDFVMKCLNAGKSVVTSNKELVAMKAPELFEAARLNNVNFMYEAAVCGGIPVLRPLIRCLAGNNINEIYGILNGTTNFILTKMIDDSMSFESALKLAQDNGYAEKDPTADIEGLDACRKICILASLVFGKHIYPQDVYVKGITGVSLSDVFYADKAGYAVKLIGRAKKAEGGGIYISVEPALISKTDIISDVEGVFNALAVNGDFVGDVMFYGRGAGKEATASAVAGDVIDCLRHPAREIGFDWKTGGGRLVKERGTEKGSLYIRGFAKEKEKALTAIREAFGGVTVTERENPSENELAFITGEGVLNELTEISSGIRDFVPASVMRIYR